MTILDDDEIKRLYASHRSTNERELLDWERDFPPNEPSFSRRRVAIMFWASLLGIIALAAIFIAWRIGREIDAVALPSAAPAPPHQLEDSRRDRILLNRLATEQARKSQQESTMKKKAAKKSPSKKKKVTHPAKAKKVVNLPPAQPAAPAVDPNEQRAEAAGHEQGGESASDETIED